MFPAFFSESCKTKTGQSTDLASNYLCAHYWITLAVIVCINALVLSGHLSWTTGLSVNVGLGGALALLNGIKFASILIKGDEKTDPYIPLIQTIASLAIAASGLTLLHLISIKAAVGLAMGGIILPTFIPLFGAPWSCANESDSQKVSTQQPPSESFYDRLFPI